MHAYRKSKHYVPYAPERAEAYRRAGYWIGQTHTDFLRQTHDQYGHKIAVIQNDRQLSYSELHQKSSAYGHYLTSQGINQGDFIILQSANVMAFFIALFGIFHAGARPIFALDGHGAYEVENIAKASAAKGYIRILSQSGAKDDAPTIVHKFVEPQKSLTYIQTIYGHEPLESMMTSSPNHVLDEPQKVSSEDIAFLQLSGGTTGLPKLIPRTHDDYLYSVRCSVAVSGLHSDSVQLVALPISHNFTMSSPGVLGALSAGATIVLAENGSPDSCFTLIEQHKVTQVSLVPSLALLWLNSALKEDYDLSSLEVIQVGGAELLPEIAQRLIQTFNIKLQQVYGMAEGLVNFTHLSDDLHTVIHTQGKKLSPSDERLIVNDEGEPVGHHTIGHILTRGPYTINGYYNAHDINQNAFTADGFYITGDLGYIDEQQNIVVTGRAKSQINRAGEKIAPSELENLLITHPLIQNVNVVGIKDVHLGEKIKVNIILARPESTLSLLDIRKYLMGKNVAPYKLPDVIEIMTSFQQTLIGKVKK
ncbi:(2,3-dihydroxybenzoyl)adenylate synthase [Neisseriaceae bacterium CLB008]